MLARIVPYNTAKISSSCSRAARHGARCLRRQSRSPSLCSVTLLRKSSCARAIGCTTQSGAAEDQSSLAKPAAWVVGRRNWAGSQCEVPYVRTYMPSSSARLTPITWMHERIERNLLMIAVRECPLSLIQSFGRTRWRTPCAYSAQGRSGAESKRPREQEKPTLPMRSLDGEGKFYVAYSRHAKCLRHPNRGSSRSPD